MNVNLLISSGASRVIDAPDPPVNPGWTITTHIGENPGGFNWNYKKYIAIPATNNWVVQLHGAGEGGPIDGSEISKVETNGYSKRASQGETFPFNILAPQGLKTVSVPNWAFVQQGLLNLMSTLSASKVILTGYSQGGQKSLDFLWQENPGGQELWNGNQNLITGFLIMCGNKSGGQSYNDALDRKIMCVHGTADAQIGYSQGLAIVNGYNGATPSHPDTAIMVTITGGSHSDAWVQGYNPANQYGTQAYSFVLDCLGL